MRLFGYYALHSFVNQLRKMFKTWVLIFIIACGLVGGFVGWGVSSLGDAARNENAQEAPESYEESKELEQNGLTLYGQELDQTELTELGAGALVLIILVFMALLADTHGGKIFLPADVNLLFASPMKPQSVLMFRLVTKLGMLVVFIFYVPVLVTDLGLSVGTVLCLLLALALTVSTGTLIQVLLYLLCAEHPAVKKNLRNGVYGLLLLIGAGYYAAWKSSGTDPVSAAFQFFNAPAGVCIPVWGWLKGICTFAISENYPGVAACITGSVLVNVALALVIGRVKADFYEDAMAKSEETAALLEVTQSEKSVGFRRRKKDRSDKLRRDTMYHGSGANMFFFRSMYNRFRFAHLGFLTKTTETYFVTAVGTVLISRFLLHQNHVYIVVLSFAGLAFFRALGNPLAEDTEKAFFRMIPASTWSKLFYSMIAGTTNCLLDILPGLIFAGILLGENVWMLLAWIPFILSVDFLSANVGAFINLSVPVEAGKTVKQVVQVMFIYFGLLPDGAVIAWGYIAGHMAAGVVGAGALNICLGFLFLALTPLFLDPPDRPYKTPVIRTPEELKTAGKAFSRMGLGCFVILLVSVVLQISLSYLAGKLAPGLLNKSWSVWVFTFAPMYMIAVPAGLLVMGKAPEKKTDKHTIGMGNMACISLICIFMMYAGNIIGMVVNRLFLSLLGIQSVSGLTTLAMDDSLVLKILFVVILAPMIEEYIFRRRLIDRMRPYGEKLAVVTSALMFGLFHGNLQQFFYASALGLVFGCVYVKTGRLRYSTGLHMGINFLGSVVSAELLKRIDLNALNSLESYTPEAMETLAASREMIVFGAYILAMIAAAIVGLVLLCVKSRRIRFSPTELELPGKHKLRVVYGNAGMLLLILGCMGMIALSCVGL